MKSGLDAMPLFLLENIFKKKRDLRKNFDLKNIVTTTDFLEHKLLDFKKVQKRREILFRSQ